MRQLNLWRAVLLAVMGALVPLSAHADHLYVIRDSAAPCLRFRDGPSTQAAEIDCLVPGTIVTVLESTPYWRRVQLQDGREGWVAKMFLEISAHPAPVAPVGGPDPNAWLEVHFVDVGQGDAIWIRTHDDGIDGNGIFEGRNIVIDGGPYSADSSNPFLPYLESRAHHNAIIDAPPPSAMGRSLNLR